MLCKFSTELTTNIIRRCFASSKQTSQRQSPMYCKIFIEVTKTSPHKSTGECLASSKQTSQRQSPMYCKILTDVTKTIADVLQDLNRSHKDNRHKSINENVLPVRNGSHEVITKGYRQWVCKILTVINISQVCSGSSVIN